MTTNPTTNGQGPISEFGGLDELCDSRARSATSLFRLLCDVAVDARLLNREERQVERNGTGDGLTLWSNRPGQNANEANALALLTVWLVGGITVGMIVQFLGHAWWAWPTAILVTPPITFLAIQIYSILVALCAVGLTKLGVGDGQANERSLLFLSLSGLTVLALLAPSWGGPVFLAASVPWLVWAGLNFSAWVALLLRSLFAALKQGPAADSPPPNA